MATVRDKHAIAHVAQRPLGKPQHGGVVLGEQNRFCAGRNGQRRRKIAVRHVSRAREQHVERRPFPDLRANANESARLGNDTMNR